MISCLQILSGSSDGTVRLWSLGQQRCIETFPVHDEGVWALDVSEDFNTFYSGGRDKRVCMTELRQGEERGRREGGKRGQGAETSHIFFSGGDEGLVLFTEDSPILDLVLDTSGSCDALWVATTATHVNRWPVDPCKANGFDVEGVGSSAEEEEEEGITYIDDEVAPVFTKPIATLPGM